MKILIMILKFTSVFPAQQAPESTQSTISVSPFDYIDYSFYICHLFFYFNYTHININLFNIMFKKYSSAIGQNLLFFQGLFYLTLELTALLFLAILLSPNLFQLWLSFNEYKFRLLFF